MHSSNNVGNKNPTYTNPTTDLNVETDHTEPKSTTVKQRTFLNNTYNILTDKNNECNANDNLNSRTGCVTAYRRFLTDWRSFSLLMLLYTLRGLLMGLVASVPLIIIEKTNSYGIQAIFNNTIWAYTLRILWAPLVDAFYFKRIGRRKSWLLPVQLLMCCTLLLLYYQIDNLIDTLQIGWLTGVFFFLYLLAATQDIVVDGWALTLLKRENVGLAMTCNLVGQQFGRFIGHTVFLNLASADFANYFRSEPGTEGLVSISDFILILAFIFFIATTLIFIFKHEGKENQPAENTVIKSYVRLYETIKLPAVRWFAMVQVTKNIGFAAVIGVSTLKLVEYGLPKETEALLSGSLIPVTLLFPLLIARWTAGRKPLSLFLKVYAVGLVVSGAVAVMVWTTGEVKDKSTTGTGFPVWYFPLLFLVKCALNMYLLGHYASVGAFFCKISDPEYGSTFMALYNAIQNLGFMSSNQLALWIVDPITITTVCVEDAVTVCDKPTTRVFDGYYIETIACIVFGYCWLFSVWKLINKLQEKPESEWRPLRK